MTYALTPNAVELIPTLGALPPRGGPVQDPVLTEFAAQREREEFYLMKLRLFPLPSLLYLSS